MSNWLPITEYSVKSGMSISTIRRKIKARALRYKLDNGKYLVFDDGTRAETSDNNVHESSQIVASSDDLILLMEELSTKVSQLNKDLIEEKDRTIKAQEDLIIYLRKQIDELKMLVSVLEKKDQLRP